MRNLAVAILVVLFATPLSASADEGIIPGVYAGLVAGYTATVDQPERVPDPMGPAVGLRAGVTIPLTSLYVGGLFLYHSGEDIDVERAAGTQATLTSSSYMLGGEVGYELGLGPLVLRPSLGIGYHNASIEELLEDGDQNSVYLSPGINAMVVLGLMVGAELRYNAIINDNIKDSVSILGTIGVGI